MSSKLEQVVEHLEAGNPPHPDAGFLGADLAPEDSNLVLIPVPWEVTASFGGGTSEAPGEIVRASHQMDLEDRFFDRPYRAGISMLKGAEEISVLNQRTRQLALNVIDATEHGAVAESALNEVNSACELMNDWVYAQAKLQLEGGRLAGVIGGDHSVPLGLVKALADHLGCSFGILHFDAHHDLRVAYEGFAYSHASIMYNLMESTPHIDQLVQVGIRDYSREEVLYRQSQEGRITTFYAADMFRRQAGGETFGQLAEQIIEKLPELVYVSFDIDALDPTYCPNTGTPVPGGLSFNEASYLLEQLAASGRKVIGFDLNEVSTDSSGWDANVGARILYKLCGCLVYTQELC